MTFSRTKIILKFFIVFICFSLLHRAPLHAAHDLLNERRNPAPPSLQNRIITLVESYPAMQKVKVGVYATSLETGKVLVDFHGDMLLIPASNQKLFTTAAALAKLGSDFSFPTIVYAQQLPEEGVISGPMYIKGFGDPSLVNEELWEMARQIRLAGVHKILGDLIYDDSYFARDEEDPADCPPDDPPFWYNAKSGALSLNFNTIALLIRPASEVGQKPTVRCNPSTTFVQVINRSLTSPKSTRNTLSVTRNDRTLIVSGQIPAGHPQVTVYRSLPDPSQYTAEVLKEALVQMGIEISGDVRQGAVPDECRVIYRHQSKSLATIIASLNKVSNNFMAQQVLKTMGAEIKGNPGTTAKGLAVIEDFLEESGLDKKSFLPADGCGLSRRNLTTPKMIVDLLTYVYQKFEYQPEYLSSLAIGGIDGTLERRFHDPKMYRRVRAKTGLLKGISCLSGYLFSSRNGVIAFAILMNSDKNNSAMCKKVQDRIVALLLN